MKELINIQNKLKVKKTRYNKFGDFYYYNANDILEALKPLCKENNCVILLRDEVVEVGGRVYVKATATLQFGDKNNGDTRDVSATAYANEPESMPKMSSPQVTGAVSSYARKYALNGLFCIDDANDPDALDNSQKTAPQVNKQASNIPTQEPKAGRAVVQKPTNKMMDDCKKRINDGMDVLNKAKIAVPKPVLDSISKLDSLGLPQLIHLVELLKKAHKDGKK